MLYLADEHNQIRLVSDAEFAEALRNRLSAVPEESQCVWSSWRAAKRPSAAPPMPFGPRAASWWLPACRWSWRCRTLCRLTRAAFAGTFYEKLLEHGRVDLACNQARVHVQADKLPGSSIPVLFMRLRNGRMVEVRSQEELAYLDRVIAEYCEYEDLYTPLPGVVEEHKALPEGHRSKLAGRFMPTEFVKLVEHGFGAEQSVERVPFDDLRKAVARYRRLVLLGEPGSGKTTTLRRLAYDYAVAAQTDAQAPLPLYVSLGAYIGDESALTYVQGCAVQGYAGALTASLATDLQQRSRHPLAGRLERNAAEGVQGTSKTHSSAALSLWGGSCDLPGAGLRGGAAAGEAGGQAAGS